MDSKTEPATLIFSKTHMTQEQQWLAYVAKLRNEHDEEITRLKAELERERELRKELAVELNRLIITAGHAMHEDTISHVRSLIEKQKID